MPYIEIGNDSGLDWASGDLYWIGLNCTGVWTELNWMGLDWTAQCFIGMYRSETDWIGPHVTFS